MGCDGIEAFFFVRSLITFAFSDPSVDSLMTETNRDQPAGSIQPHRWEPTGRPLVDNLSMSKNCWRHFSLKKDKLPMHSYQGIRWIYHNCFWIFPVFGCTHLSFGVWFFHYRGPGSRPARDRHVSSQSSNDPMQMSTVWLPLRQGRKTLEGHEWQTRDGWKPLKTLWCSNIFHRCGRMNIRLHQLLSILTPGYQGLWWVATFVITRGSRNFQRFEWPQLPMQPMHFLK